MTTTSSGGAAAPMAAANSPAIGAVAASTANAIGCTDGCKRTVANMDEALAKAWRFLEISKRWRCPACVRELDVANQPKEPA